MNRAELERRAALWRRHHAVRASTWGLAAGLAAAALAVRSAPGLAAALGILIAAAVTGLLRRRTSPVSAEVIAAQLNRLCPTLEESAGLWLRDAAALPLLEQLQLRRLEAAWAALPDRATLACPPPRALHPALLAASAAAFALVTLHLWPTPTRPSAAVVASGSPPAPPAAARPAALALRHISLEIVPPAYLSAAPRRLEVLDGEVPEGSSVTWDLGFDGEPAAVALSSARDPRPLTATALGGGRFRVTATLTDTLLYQVALTRPDGTRVVLPELHVLKVLRDQPPRLAWLEPARARTLVDPASGPAQIAVSLTATDDHAVDSVTLVATVAKGTGEGVKFREQEITLPRLDGSAPAGATFGRTLDLLALGLEPGDELYFHAVAADRRTPAPNRTRSETRFVVLRGPDTALAEPGLALAGVNRLPQYFRSQRQLIIDTERLLADRPRLTDAQFRERSDDIGVDQKLLRLRYGQFLGEEFEPTTGSAPREAQMMALAGTLRGAPRAAMNQAAAIERAVEAQHQHPTPVERENRPLTFEEIAAPHVHRHDIPEAATFFGEEVKASLRAVLAAMWEAETHLRTARPDAALPAEHRALELLKALQQSDRIYVKRVGNESAPLKIDERRLRGELDAIPTRATGPAPAAPPDADATAVRAALSALTPAGGSPLPDDVVVRVEARLVAAALEQPALYVPALELWRRRATGLSSEEQATLRQSLWRLAPPARATPDRSPEVAPNLARTYFDALQAEGGGAR